MDSPRAGPVGDSVSFDRAADYYDRTRALPPDVMVQVVDLLGDELSGRGPVLEVGVGTGRIGLPLHERGIELAGIDLSPQMLDKLVEKAGGAMPFPLLLGDVTRLPFATNSLGAAIAVHVLHLIPDWKRALDEVVRVISRGGVLLVDLGRWGTGRVHEITEYWTRAAGLEARHPGLHDPEILDGAMKARGARIRELDPLRGSRSTTYEEAISQYESGLWSFTWRVSEEARKKAAAETRSWVKESFGPLGESFDEEVVVRWRAYDL
jgi:SAM-dependent methyltransferase